MSEHPTSPTAFSGLFKKESKVVDDWIEWYGGKCPVHPETRVDVTFMDGKVFRDGYALEWDWEWGYGGGNLVAYRVVTPKPDLEEVSEYLRDNDWKETPKPDLEEAPTLPHNQDEFISKKYICGGMKNPYYKEYPYDTIDIYRVLQVYEVTDPCIQHAVKKLLCAGQRGYKEVEKDIDEAIQSMERWKQMREEEDGNSD